MKKHIVVLYGGKSTEHDISCRSASFIFRNLDPQKFHVHGVGIDRQGKWWPLNPRLHSAPFSPSVPIEKAQHLAFKVDNSENLFKEILSQISGLRDGSQLQKEIDNCVFFPVLHGAFGEDGTLQGLLEIADVAYVGAGTLGSAVGMDKVIAKRLVHSSGIDVVPWVDFRDEDWHQHRPEIEKRISLEIGYPAFVKPARLGSSIGVSKVKSHLEFEAAVDHALQFDSKILVEKALDVREIECAALGSYEPIVSVAGEVVTHADFYSYEAKYIKKDAASVIVPADLANTDLALVQQMTRKIYCTLDLYGMARVDFFLNKADRKFYFNEVNTIPGFTDISQFPLLWKESGLSASDLLEKLIDSASERQRRKRMLKLGD